MLSENIKALRKARGFSQEELALKLNVVRQTISKWEKGLSVPDAGMLIQIAEALEVPVNTLLGEHPVEAVEQEAVRAIAAKLELMNEQYARKNERSRRIWRCIFVAIGILSLMGAARELLALHHAHQSMLALEGITGIIGGADIPTSIYVGRHSVLPVILAAAISVAGILYTRRK